MAKLMLFSGGSNFGLATRVAKQLSVELGHADVGRFSDGEVTVELHENVRGQDVFLMQSTCAPTNDNIMELMIMADALHRASAQRVTAVVPYFGYARQDRRPRSARVAISAKVVADMIGSVGIDRILTVDLHADQIQGFFNIPVDNIYGSPVLVDHILSQRYADPIVISPDVGGVVRARAIAKQIDDLELAIIDKRRPQANESRVMNVIGDVTNKTCIIVDDIVDTAGTLCTAAEALKEEGAKQVVCYITHPVLSGPAIERINASQIDRMVVTDTIPLHEAARKCEKIEQLSLDRILGESIRRVSNEESISALFR
ncbi:MAG TPA: ribose-phosphate pyrophosphokinase [Gammaproteobacteria bacterium]|nr:ribose-phosphate pyrophosphokinase [Gammaproteobacteria bacterium]|tara:strand:+ start:297 stop:1241 length:945 start_codon:yes stop_codon:yes gene_type:complete